MKDISSNKIILLFLLILFISLYYLTPVIADEFTNIFRQDSLLFETDLAGNEMDYVDGLQINEISNLAKKNSINITKANYDLEQAEYQYDNLKDIRKIEPTNQRPYVDDDGNFILITDDDQELEMKISKDITYYQAKNSVDIAEKRIILEEQNLEHSVTDLLINYSKAIENVELAKENVVRSWEYVDTTNTQREQGYALKSTVLDSEVALSQTENGLKGAEMQYMIAREELLSVVGIEDYDGLEIESITPDEEVIDITIDDLDIVLDFALNNRIDYLMQQDQVNYEKKRYEIYDEHYTYYGNQQDIIRQQEIVYEKEKLDLLQLERDIRSQIYQTILGYNNAVEQLDSLELNVEKAKESLRIEEMRYELRMNTLMDVLNAQVNLTQAENQLLEGKYQIMTMKNNLEKVIGGTVSDYEEYITTISTEDNIQE